MLLDLGAALSKGKKEMDGAAIVVDHDEERLAAVLEKGVVAGKNPVPAPVDLTSILPAIVDVKADFYAMVTEAEKIRAEATALVVVNDETAKQAAEIGVNASRLVKKIDARQKEILEAPAQWIQGVKNIVSAMLNPLQDAKTLTTRKINEYRAKAELDKREAEKKIREASEKLQAELNADAKAKGIEAPLVAPAALPKTNSNIKTDTGGTVYQTSRWICRVEDPGKVPHQYCIPSLPLLNEAVKNGVREIPGCKIEQVTETRMRG